MENTIIKMSGITKSFSGVTVLNGVNFDLQRGEVHVLMGENGAGKSTLMKILTGVYKPNDGEIYLADESGTLKKTDIESPKAALALGISMVFQEFNLMPNMSISENISIGFEPVKHGVIDYTAMNGTAAEMLKKVGLDLAVTTEVGRLTTAEKQGVEIAKCLSHNGRIIKQMAQTINFLKENGDMDFDELSRRAEAANEKCSVLTEKLKATEARMSEVEELKKHVINYLRTRDIFRAYKDSGYSKRYLAEHEQEILLHRAAKKAFNDLGLKKLPTVKALQAEYAALLAEKRAAYPAYREARAEMKKLLTYRANAEAILGMNANTGKRQKEHEQR